MTRAEAIIRLGELAAFLVMTITLVTDKTLEIILFVERSICYGGDNPTYSITRRINIDIYDPFMLYIKF